MARRSRILASLEGKLGAVIRREVSKVLRRLKSQIARRERELTALKAEYAKGMDLLRKRLTTGAAAARRRPRRRARRINWKKEGLLGKDSAGGYRKVSAKPPRKRKARRGRPARVQKPAARPETPGA
ncbi:MAG: hypothetical protein HYY88_10590 [candidate division NC10 bacterium]|nr:hypothetical protein [candidate division NC10 bacterium]